MAGGGRGDKTRQSSGRRTRAATRLRRKAKGKSLSRKQRKQLEKTLKEMQAAGEDTYDIEEQLGYFDEAPAPVAAK